MLKMFKPRNPHMDCWSELSDYLSYMISSYPHYHRMILTIENKYDCRIHRSFATVPICLTSQFVICGGIIRENYYTYEDLSIQLTSSLSFDEASDISATSLGRKPMKQSKYFQTEESFPISSDNHTTWHLPSGSRLIS